MERALFFVIVANKDICMCPSGLTDGDIAQKSGISCRDICCFPCELVSTAFMPGSFQVKCSRVVV